MSTNGFNLQHFTHLNHLKYDDSNFILQQFICIIWPCVVIKYLKSTRLYCRPDCDSLLFLRLSNQEPTRAME